ncbi:uncharacterized protein [Rutidosis leptorrhynchoides]|uniref:uncharacterized protein n=1 Tax=Rutidosis leptorrhynchoides TaxID=125765 RepID=UPI003A99B203
MGRNAGSGEALLDLETNAPNSSSKESRLLVCKSSDDDLLKKLEASNKKLQHDAIVLFIYIYLSVFKHVCRHLINCALYIQNFKNCDIEAHTGDESEYIEIDLMLGVADLNTPEAVAAAESAIVGSQPVISLDASSSASESEDSSDDDSYVDDDVNDENNKGTRFKSKSQTLGGKSIAAPENGQKRKRSKIVELS